MQVMGGYGLGDAQDKIYTHFNDLVVVDTYTLVIWGWERVSHASHTL